jgi:hypothetical protein
MHMIRSKNYPAPRYVAAERIIKTWGKVKSLKRARDAART